ncbi:SRPBCC domain-containing protein [Mesorhizobium sp. M00.F.Ca.ET.186.01.1.1]|nr:SRPBCC domain-containing protein [Mesorhizobium sp. M00.F.Ca.ET.186.01.1.1]
MNKKQSAATPKVVGQTAAAGFQIGVRRTLPVEAEPIWLFLTSPEGTKLWLGDLPPLSLAAEAAFESQQGISGQFKIVKPYQQLRLRWKKSDWEKFSTLQIRLISAKDGKTTVSFHQENLADADMREQMKEHWESVIEQLKTHVC